MIKDFAKAWERYNQNLKVLIANSENHKEWDYIDLLKLTFESVINTYLDDEGREVFDTEKIVTIDDGCYSGTLVFVLHRGSWPNIDDYIYTSVEYGSCCVCDTLQGIQYDGEYETKPNERQVKDYLNECLHLLQNCFCMKEYE